MTRDELLDILNNTQKVEYESDSASQNQLFLKKLSDRNGDRENVTLLYFENTRDLETAIQYLGQYGIDDLKTICIRSPLDVIQAKRSGQWGGIKLLVKHQFPDSQLLAMKCAYKLLELHGAIVPLKLPFFRMNADRLLCEYVRRHIDGFVNLFDSFDDSESKATLKEIIRASVSNDVYRLPQGSQTKKYWENYLHLNDECWVNCGSSTGDSILKFLVEGHPFKRIYAFEGGRIPFRILKNNINRLKERDKRKIHLYNKYIGIDGEEDNFDRLFCRERVSLINMDIEGAEVSVLRGATRIIRRDRPVLAICAYHKPSDLLEIPNLISSVTDGYKFLLRKYIGFMPGALNEWIYYAIPIERLV